MPRNKISNNIEGVVKYRLTKTYLYSVIQQELSEMNLNVLKGSEINSSVWSKLLESREDLSKLNKTLEDLDQRLKRLSMNICVKCKDKDFC
ncbi:unnamed protein product [Rotaria sp. Silwood2]|nr:unnamed protein product [Rotaria sp. Silwood2]